jgi:hypothetical protein
MDWSKRNNMATIINFEEVRKKVAPSYQEAMKKEAFNVAQEILNEKLDEYLKEIEDHPVSEELNQGPDGQNLSNTLNGKENLFAFIGFDAADKPIENLKKIIKENTFLEKSPAFDKKNFQLKFNVFTPSVEEIRSQTPLPFENGRSWVKGVEDGITGFGYYVYGLLFPNSRSGRGIQSKNKIRTTTYKPVKYISELYNNFIKNLS